MGATIVIKSNFHVLGAGGNYVILQPVFYIYINTVIKYPFKIFANRFMAVLEITKIIKLI